MNTPCMTALFIELHNVNKHVSACVGAGPTGTLLSILDDSMHDQFNPNYIYYFNPKFHDPAFN